ncbi:CsbD family protein [Candidatus Sodalis endolongispinus]|uniref:CsbD family protein n=1 Tax=Candidatus Sodalis endolongispinus TaxID=2812662 RepID=A0ABS5YDF0_9GAMM|nr:CsbD family protein [Candidatus Sodalis endolongispinus]MBT9432146.1 CsbD family protein [Candidatus Sodalis endolongispinus]
MNKDEASGNWKQFKGKVKEQWGKFTDDDLTIVEGKRDQLVGKIQERYGYGKESAETEVNDWKTRNKYWW